eukprot:scaffold183802_cov59-Attheya_sp.AAC.2
MVDSLHSRAQEVHGRKSARLKLLDRLMRLYMSISDKYSSNRNNDRLAQLVEHRIPDPKARSSNLLAVT